jgi:hypothetical protein
VCIVDRLFVPAVTRYPPCTCQQEGKIEYAKPGNNNTATILILQLILHLAKII